MKLNQTKNDVFDITLLSNLNKYSKNEYLISKFGFDNVIILQNISSFGYLNTIFNTIDKTKYYVVLSKSSFPSYFGNIQNIQNIYYSMYIIRKSSFDKYISHSRESLIFYRHKNREHIRKKLTQK